MLVKSASLAAIGLSSMAAAAPLTNLVKKATCYSGVYMIVGRGSTEDPGEGSPGVVADMIAARIPDSGSVAVDYPASITSPPYYDSVSAGITDTINKIHDYVDACGSESRIVLIGYSQGGNVMTDVLAGGVDKPDPIDPSYAQYITGVVVFGDPSFTANQSFDQGTATTDGVFARQEGGDSLALLNTYAPIIKSYCNDEDTFCASGNSLATHLEEVDDFKQAATDFIVSIN